MKGITKFSDTALRNLKPGPTRQVLHEAGGMYLRVEPSGSRTFYARFKLDGKTRWVRLGEFPGTTLLSARAECARVLREAGEARQGRADDPAAVRRVEKVAAKVERLKHPTVEQFATVYLERYAKPNKKSWAEDERILNKDIVPVVGELRLSDLERRHVVQVLDKVADRGHPKQAAEVLKVIRRMLNFAVERGEIPSTPCIGVKPPARYTPRDRVLSEAEIIGLFKALPNLPCGEPMRLMIQLQLLTVVRPGEARAARWDEIDFEAKRWVIAADRMKMGSEHVVPLTDEAVKVLKRAKELAGDSDYVFPGRDPDNDVPVSDQALMHVIDRGREILAQHGVGPFRPHDLRRTATTLVSSLGFALVKDRLLAHAPRSVADRHYDMYQYEPEKRAALEALERKIGELRKAQS